VSRTGESSLAIVNVFGRLLKLRVHRRSAEHSDRRDRSRLRSIGVVQRQRHGSIVDARRTQKKARHKFWRAVLRRRRAFEKV
jgi:hypothetical protein